MSIIMFSYGCWGKYKQSYTLHSLIAVDSYTPGHKQIRIFYHASLAIELFFFFDISVAPGILQCFREANYIEFYVYGTPCQACPYSN